MINLIRGFAAILALVLMATGAAQAHTILRDVSEIALAEYCADKTPSNEYFVRVDLGGGEFAQGSIVCVKPRETIVDWDGVSELPVRQ